MMKFKRFFDFSKEEKWLEEMARNGYLICEANGGFHKFNTVDKLEECTIRIDYRTFNNKAEYHNYCTLLEDSGWLHLAGTKSSGTQYFLKVRPDAGDDIFSDQLSKAGRYKRLSNMWLSLFVTYCIIIVPFVINGNLPTKLYLTPGLWEMKGWHFVLAFLFETPFALLRILSIIYVPVMIIIIIGFLYYAIKSYSLYKKEQQVL